MGVLDDLEQQLNIQPIDMDKLMQNELLVEHTNNSFENTNISSINIDKKQPWLDINKFNITKISERLKTSKQQISDLLVKIFALKRKCTSTAVDKKLSNILKALYFGSHDVQQINEMIMEISWNSSN